MPEVTLVPLADFNPDPLNPRSMPEDMLAALMRSLDAFGCVQPIVARQADGLVIGGHQRLEAARRLGWSAIPVCWWEGTEREARALNLALNQIQGEWDPAQLATVLAELADVESLADAVRDLDTTWTDVAGFSDAEVLDRLAAALDDGAPPA